MYLPRFIVLSLFVSVSLSFTVLIAQEKAREEQPIEHQPIEASVQLSQYLNSFSSYEANFQQKLSGNQNQYNETTSGRFTMKRPDRFRWQIFSPYEQTIIADGKSVWTIDTDLEQVTVTDINESIANSPIMLMTSENVVLNKIFSIIKLDGTSEKELFLLKPIDNNANFEYILLGFKETVLNSIELHDSLGQVTTITMTNSRTDPIISDAEFEYQELADFDFIDSRMKPSELEKTEND